MLQQVSPLSSTTVEARDEGPGRINCKGSRGSPRTSSSERSGGRAGDGARNARRSRRFGKSDWAAGAHGEIHSHAAGRGGNEIKEALHAGNPRVVTKQQSPRAPHAVESGCFVGRARGTTARGNSILLDFA